MSHIDLHVLERGKDCTTDASKSNSHPQNIHFYHLSELCRLDADGSIFS